MAEQRSALPPYAFFSSVEHGYPRFDPEKYVAQVKKTAGFVKERLQASGHGDFTPKVVLQLGSGWEKIAQKVKPIAEFNYSDLEGFSSPTVSGHAGKMILGHYGEVPVMVYMGRNHYYERVGQTPFPQQEATFGVHVGKELGANVYFATNAAGGINRFGKLPFKPGDLMIIKDHLDLLIQNPLLGPLLPFGDIDPKSDRFIPQSDMYTKELRNMLKRATKGFSVRRHVKEGSYAGVTGPTYETQTDIQALRRSGARAVGMSTVNEAIVARQRHMAVVGLSSITNVVKLNGKNATNHEEVLAALNNPKTQQRIETIFDRFFAQLAQSDFVR